MDKVAPAVDVHAVATPRQEHTWTNERLVASGWGALVLSALILAGGIAISLAVRDALEIAPVMLVMLVPVLFNAAIFGFWAGVFSAVVSFLAFNFLFIEPFLTLRVARPGDILTLAIFLLVAGTTGFIAGRMREQTNAARSRAAMLELLSAYSSQLADAPTREAITELMLLYLSRVTGGAAVSVVDRNGSPAIDRAIPNGAALEAEELEAAGRAWRRKAREQAAAAGWSGSRFDFEPLTIGRAVVGVIGYSSWLGQRWELVQRRQAAAAIIRQGVVAMERLGFAEQAAVARARAEIETVRALLLSSLSHDLRTPLSTILGSVTSLRELDDRLTPEARADLLLAIEEETRRLSRYVENLLNMTRLQAGVELRLEWTEVADIVNAVVGRTRRAFPDRQIGLRMSKRLPMIRTDGALLEQVLFNLVENAVRFSPTEKPVSVAVRKNGEQLWLSVIDDGPGIGAEQLPGLFERFRRGTHDQSSVAGLGLSICKAIVDALGGELEVESPRRGRRGGTAVHVRLGLPLSQPEPR